MFRFNTYEKCMKDLPAVLDEGEEVIEAVWGGNTSNLLWNTGLLALTNKRILKFSRTLMGYEFTHCPFHQITLVNQEIGVRRYAIYICFFNGVFAFYPSFKYKVQAKKLVSELNKRINKEEEKPKPPKTAEGGTPLSNAIRELAKLKDEGLITKAEYDRKKKEILEG